MSYRDFHSSHIKKTYIFDLDGTLALIDHRRHWLDRDQYPDLSSDDRWSRFFADSVNDQPNTPVVETLRALYETRQFKIIIFYFLNPLIESLSKPQRQHLRELCDALLVCETEHTFAFLCIHLTSLPYLL